MHKTVFSLLALIALLATATAHGADAPYGQAKTLQVGGEGGWDYLTVDSAHKLLYVPRSSHTLVLAEADGKTVADIPGQQRNHGVAIAPDLNRGFITDGKAGDVTIFDTTTNQVLGKVKAAEDADGIIYDPASKKVLISCGDAAKLVAIAADVDPKTGQAESVDLGGKPEFLAADGKGKAYVNLQDKNHVAVVDTKTMKVLDKWATAPGGSPVGMAIDAEHGRLYVGCRNPQKLIVMDAADGKVLADLPIGAGVDATKFDDGYAFASCRDGTLAVAKETSPGKFEIVQTVKTPAGARTMDVDSMTHAVYLPTAEFEKPPAGGGGGGAGQRSGRPTAKPNSFMVVVVERAEKTESK